MLGCTSAAFTKDEILMAIGITAVVVLALTAFAFQTKYVIISSFFFIFMELLYLFISCSLPWKLFTYPILLFFLSTCRYDFTMCGGFVLVSFIVLFIFGILAIIFQNKVSAILKKKYIFYCYYYLHQFWCWEKFLVLGE